jgi:membrane protease YdiL (CAAX protease family)
VIFHLEKEAAMGVFIRDGRLRTGWRVTLYMLAYLLGMLALQVVVLGAYSVTLLVQGQTTMPELTARLTALDLPLWLFTVLKAVDALWVLLLTWLFGRFLDRRRLADFGLWPAKSWLEDVRLGLVLGAVQMALIVGIAWIGGWVVLAGLPEPVIGARIKDATLGFVLFVLVAVGEELLFRGYVQTNVQEGIAAGRRNTTAAGRRERAVAGLQTATTLDRRPAAVALGVTSILFGLFHALNPNLTGLGLLNLILAGVALGVGYWVTSSLWLPMAYHLSWNFVQGSVLGLPVSGMRYGGLLIVADYGAAPWLTGHTFGPEGGLLGTLMLLGTLGVFWWWGRETGRLEGRKRGRLKG